MIDSHALETTGPTVNVAVPEYRPFAGMAAACQAFRDSFAFICSASVIHMQVRHSYSAMQKLETISSSAEVQRMLQATACCSMVMSFAEQSAAAFTAVGLL